MITARVLFCVLGWAGAGAVRAYSDEAPFFMGLGDLPGGVCWSQVLAISWDGSTVVGCSEAASGLEAYRWTNPATGGDGMVGLGDLPGDPFLSIAWGVNVDGLVVVGCSQTDADATEAFRWTDPAQGGEGMISLGDLPGGPIFSAATCVSQDGTIAAGWATPDSGLGEAFRWTDPDNGGDGMVGLGFLPGGTFSRIMAMSPDGFALVGRGGSANGVVEGLRWTDPDQGGEGMIGLGDLPGGEFRSNANDVSDDGTMVVGASAISTGGVEAYLWTDPAAGGAGMVGLGHVPSYAESEACALSADGSVIVGVVWTEGLKQATYWTDPADGGTGLVLLQSLLEDEYGLDLSGWTLKTAEDISADGRTIVGDGINPDGNPEGWIAYLGPPCYGDADGDNDTDHADLGLLLADWGCTGGDCPGDLDDDGDTDQSDLGILLADWGCGT